MSWARMVPVMVTAVEIVPMKRTPSILHQTADPSCAESARHATLRGLCRRWAASTRPHFPRRMRMSTSQASRGSWPFLLVVIQPSSQCPRSSCCPIQASGAAVPRARPPSRTRPVCTARPRLASRRVSSSGLATDSSPAGLPHCAAETLGGSSNFQTRALKTEVKFPSMSHACLCSLARSLGCDKCGCASLQREGGGLWARPPVQSPDACASVAEHLASNKLHDFLHEPEHWHIHDLLHDAMLRALFSTCDKYWDKRNTVS